MAMELHSTELENFSASAEVTDPVSGVRARYIFSSTNFGQNTGTAPLGLRQIGVRKWNNNDVPY
jgi:hypothetical protein